MYDFDNLPERAQIALFDMVFQLGLGGVQKFKKMLLAIGERDWNKAATREQKFMELFFRATEDLVEHKYNM